MSQSPVFTNDIGQSLLFTVIFLASIFALPLLLSRVDRPRPERRAPSGTPIRVRNNTRPFVGSAGPVLRASRGVDVEPSVDGSRSAPPGSSPPLSP